MKSISYTIPVLILLSVLILGSNPGITVPLETDQDNIRVEGLEELLSSLENPALDNATKQSQVDEYIGVEGSNGFPVTNTTTAYFLYQNSSASEIYLLAVGGNVWLFGAPLLTQISGTDLWYTSVNLHPTTRLPYEFWVDGVTYPDVYNKIYRDTFSNKYHNVIKMPEYSDDGSYNFAENVGSQIINSSHISSIAGGNNRTFSVYLPPGYDENTDLEYSTAYFLDSRYLWDMNASAMLDYYITNEIIEPIIGVFFNVFGQAVTGWYNFEIRNWWGQEFYGECDNPQFLSICMENSINSVVNELVPLIDRTYRTKAVNTERSIAGISSGSEFASVMLAKYPDIFSRGEISAGYFPEFLTSLNSTINEYLEDMRLFTSISSIDSSDESVEVQYELLQRLYELNIPTKFVSRYTEHSTGLLQPTFGDMLSFLFSDSESDYCGTGPITYTPEDDGLCNVGVTSISTSESITTPLITSETTTTLSTTSTNDVPFSYSSFGVTMMCVIFIKYRKLE